MWDREEWDEVCEHGLVGVVLALVTVAVLAFGGVRGSEFSLVIGLAGLALLLAAVRWALRGSHRLLLHPMIWPALAFVGYAAWRYTQTDVAYPARQELLLLAACACVFVATINHLYRQEPLQWVTHFLVVLGCLVASYAIIQWVSGSTLVLWLPQPEVYVKRAGGTFINPNHLAGFLSLLLPLALAHVFVGRAKPVVKVLYGYASVVMLGGIAVSMSRGGWVATLAGLLALFAWLGWRRRELRIPVALAVALVLGGGWMFIRSSDKARARVENLTTDGNIDSGLGRPALWRPALEMWRDHRVWGVGPAQFDVRFPEYRTPRTQAAPGWVHNEYLNLLVDYGLVGAGLAGLTLALFGWSVIRTGKYVERGLSDLGSRTSNRTAFYLGAWVGLFSLALHCVVEFNLHIPGIAVTATLITALLASHVRHATERLWWSPGVVSRVALMVAVVGALAWMWPQAVHVGREGLVRNRILGAREVTPALLADLELAARQAPDNPRTAFEMGENLRRLSLQGGDQWRELGLLAVEWLERAAALNPYDAHVRLALGQTWNWLNDPEKARNHFREALALGPYDVVIHRTVAWYALQYGEPAQARQLAENTLQWQWWSNDLAREIADRAARQLQEAAAAAGGPPR